MAEAPLSLIATMGRIEMATEKAERKGREDSAEGRGHFLSFMAASTDFSIAALTMAI